MEKNQLHRKESKFSMNQKNHYNIEYLPYKELLKLHNSFGALSRDDTRYKFSLKVALELQNRKNVYELRKLRYSLQQRNAEELVEATIKQHILHFVENDRLNTNLSKVFLFWTDPENYNKNFKELQEVVNKKKQVKELECI